MGDRPTLLTVVATFIDGTEETYIDVARAHDNGATVGLMKADGSPVAIIGTSQVKDIRFLVTAQPTEVDPAARLLVPKHLVRS